jgi:hypothetical protein
MARDGELHRFGLAYAQEAHLIGHDVKVDAGFGRLRRRVGRIHPVFDAKAVRRQIHVRRVVRVERALQGVTRASSSLKNPRPGYDFAGAAQEGPRFAPRLPRVVRATGARELTARRS